MGPCATNDLVDFKTVFILNFSHFPISNVYVSFVTGSQNDRSY